MILQYDTRDVLGNRTYALRGLGDVPPRVYFDDGNARTLRGYWDQPKDCGGPQAPGFAECVIDGSKPNYLWPNYSYPNGGDLVDLWHKSNLRGMGDGGAVFTAYPSIINLPGWNDRESLPMEASQISPMLMPPKLQVSGQSLPLSWSDWFKDDSIVPKVPNWALAGLAGLAAMALIPSGGRRRR